MSGVAAVERAEKAERAGGVEDAAPLYKPSWVDALTQWVRGLPVPWWSAYMALGAVTIIPYIGLKWLYGEYASGFFPFHIIFAWVTAFVLAALHLLDDVAARCFEAFRPVMNATDAEQRQLLYQLTNMPWGPAWLATFLGVAFATVTILGLDTEYTRLLGMGGSPLFEVLDRAIFLVSWGLLGVWVYHTIRQLRLISRIYSRHTLINMFHLGPLYEFSSLSALTAILWLAENYLWYATIPAVTDDPLSGSTTIGFAVIAAVTFIWPLWGVHRLLRNEKLRLQTENARRIEAVMQETQRRTDAGEFSDMVGMKDATQALTEQAAVLDKLPTWPWQPETVRTLLTAMLLPLVIWLAQRIL
ncbi:MAG: hypothetical protein M3328_13910, partial [Chloroflexota bacterium]|nr:hypothetical protein [Chloroflexota bacterium]